jgi:hypothetical protein
MKSRWIYNDATNIVGYYNSPVNRDKKGIPAELAGFDPELFSGHKVVIDPATALSLVKSTTDVRKTLWVFRYYDLDDREENVMATRWCASSRSSRSWPSTNTRRSRR